MIRLVDLLNEYSATGCSSCTAAAKRLYDHILSMPQYDRLNWTLIGTRNDRTIHGTTTKSQHSTGNAIDWHGSLDVMSSLSRYLTGIANEYDIQNVIYYDRQWSSSNPTWRPYISTNINDATLQHRNHVHVDFKTNAKYANQPSNIKKSKPWDQILYRQISGLKYLQTVANNPSDYFKGFKRWSGDLNKAAADWFSDIWQTTYNKPNVFPANNDNSTNYTKLSHNQNVLNGIQTDMSNLIRNQAKTRVPTTTYTNYVWQPDMDTRTGAVSGWEKYNFKISFNPDF